MVFVKMISQELLPDVRQWLQIHGVDERRVHMHEDARGWSALHIAVDQSVKHARTGLVIGLLNLARACGGDLAEFVNRSTPPSARPPLYTPVAFAAQAVGVERDDIVRALVGARADPCKPFGAQSTPPLFSAAGASNEPVLRCMLDLRADPRQVAGDGRTLGDIVPRHRGCQNLVLRPNA